MWVRLLEGLEKYALRLVAQPPDVGHEDDAMAGHRGLDVYELLQRQLVELSRLVRDQADLVDVDELLAVVLPVVGVARQGRLRQQRGSKRTRDRRLAQSCFADEEIRVGKPAGGKLRAELLQRMGVADDAGERIRHGICVGAARPDCACAFTSRSRSRRCARPCSQTSRMRCRAVMLVTIASRKTMP